MLSPSERFCTCLSAIGMCFTSAENLAADSERVHKVESTFFLSVTLLSSSPPSSQPPPSQFDHSYWSHDGYTEGDDGLLMSQTPKFATQKDVFNDVGIQLLKNAYAGKRVHVRACAVVCARAVVRARVAVCACACATVCNRVQPCVHVQSYHSGRSLLFAVSSMPS